MGETWLMMPALTWDVDAFLFGGPFLWGGDRSGQG